MWSKITHLVKPRSDDSAREAVFIEATNSHEGNPNEFATPPPPPPPPNASVMSAVYELHPNLSVFKNNYESSGNVVSPPSSPSKGSKRSVFRRSLKAKLGLTPSSQGESSSIKENIQPATMEGPSPLKLAPKKVRASLQVDTFMAQTLPANQMAAAPKSEPLPPQPQTPQTEVPRMNDKDTYDPSVELQPSGTGSIRSILRDRNTPATGRSVRFFSRDAYRVISPDASEASMDDQMIPKLDSQDFLTKLKQSNASPDESIYQTKATDQDSVEDMFSPHTAGKVRKPLPFQPRHPPRSRNHSAASSRSSHSRTDSFSFGSPASVSSSSLIIPNVPADMSNLIDTSQDNVQDIAPSVDGSLRETIIKEETEGEMKREEADMSMNTIRRSSGLVLSPPFTSTPNPPRTGPRAILSPEGTVFHSMTNPESQFHSFADSPSQVSGTKFFTPDASKAVNGTVYFTPELGKSPFPSLPSGSTGPSKTIEPATLPEDVDTYSPEQLLACLRQQLDIQNEMAAQFEVDLTARDELVTILSAQLHTSEESLKKYRREVEKRQLAMRSLRRKVADLEALCNSLEDEVERSREETFDRSIMDEASEGALVVLHSNLGQLKGELEKVKDERTNAIQERNTIKEELERLRAEHGILTVKEQQLKDSLEERTAEIGRLQDELDSASRAKADAEELVEKLRQEVEEKQHELEEEREHVRLKEEGWEADRNDLEARLEGVRSDHVAHDADVDDFKQTITEKDEKLKVLGEELEAQWSNAEKADERIKSLEGEKEGLTKSVKVLGAKVEELGAQWKEAEARRAEVEEELNDVLGAKEEVEQDRDQLVDDVNFERENAEKLTQTIQELEVKLDELEQERQYALDSATRLEEMVRNRDTELDAAQARAVEREREAEELRAQMSKVSRDHGRLLDERLRNIDEMTQREASAVKQVEDVVRQKAENDVKLQSIEEEQRLLKDEMDRLRRQVHNLQQESADKEVKILQLVKERDQEREDKAGLNIALDSKQTELEFIKRKLGVKGTGGTTPAPSRISVDSHARRQTTTFATPSIRPKPRPSSITGLPKPAVLETPNKVGDSSRSTIRPTSTVKASRLPTVPRGTPLSASSLARSTSSLAQSTSTTRSRSAVQTKSGLHSRSSSVMSSSPASNVSLTESEKENAAPMRASTKRTLIPA
ncbi:hypothetical protein M422DRAFT_236296 [Sphaerobolus stellatus SS14]|uniref:Uncharacterized protein n=1 Tax=Sphaerobolus stellatus (strain SS14) TaxID=990650 RepID=A0A0C9TCV1_SPHS4|nr:hypothetical protein M422DRAFT_236296 [Sphaerobolus stellatus SS14]